MSERQRRATQTDALSVLQAPESDSRTHARAFFEKSKQRLQTTWVIGMAMATSLFVLMIGMVITAVTMGVYTGESKYPIVFGSVGAVALFTVLLWKPFDRAFQANALTQRLELILVGLEEQWAARSKIDPEKQGSCIQKASKAALSEMTKVARRADKT